MSTPLESVVPQAYLSLADIMAIADIETRRVEIPAWGGAVEVCVLTQAQKSQLVRDAQIGDGQGGTKVDNDLLQKLLIQHGMSQPALTFAQVEGLWTKRASAVEAIAKAVMEINDMLPDSKAAVEATFRPEPGVGSGV